MEPALKQGPVFLMNIETFKKKYDKFLNHFMPIKRARLMYEYFKTNLWELDHV